MDNNNVMPHSLTLEQAIISGLMAEPQSWDDVAEIISESDFFSPAHKLIFGSIHELLTTGQPCDALLVSKHMQERGTAHRAGGEDYLGQILKDSPATTANIVAYAQRVREFHVLRDMIRRAQSIVEMGFNANGRPLAEVMDIAESEIMAVRESVKSGGGSILAKAVASQVVADIDKRYHGKENMAGISTGIPELDKVTLGLEPKRLVIIAGRPSQGKTTLLMNIVENVMMSPDRRLAGKAGLVFTMEMENESIVENMMASLGRVNNYGVRSGKLEDEDWPKLTSALTRIMGMNLYLDDRAGRTLQDMRAEARVIKRRHPKGLAFIAVDYLQRMASVDKFGTRSELVGSFSAGLKKMAKDFDCPVIALAQLNRALGNRPNKRPGLSDLRDSGEIEQDGDLIMFIHREEYYNPTPENAGKAEIIVAKQRKGMTKTVHMDSALHFCRFDVPQWQRGES